MTCLRSALSLRSALLAMVLLFGVTAARAADWPGQTEGDATFENATMISDDKFPIVKLHYTTLGTPHRDAQGHVTNAVLLLHGTSGTGKDFLAPDLADHLFKPGQLLDLSRFYVVLPDGIGAGGSSKPADGLHGKFPHYGYTDQVDAQLVTLKHLGVEHLKLVAGLSMGGMQTWLWAVRYPDWMDAAVPIGAMPMQISGRNLMWRQIIINAIEDDPGWNGGTYTTPPTAWTKIAGPLSAYMSSNAERIQQAGPDRARTIGFYDAVTSSYQARDAATVLYVVRSSADYDPQPLLRQIHAPLLAVNFEDDLLNPVELAPLVRQAIAVAPSAHLAELQGGFGHQSITHAELWLPAVTPFLDGVAGWKTE
jgi:homoserine O-acetyltransferase/O-succinyltransferase